MFRGRRQFVWAIPCLVLARPQETPVPVKRVEFSFFSGRVDEFSDDSITVSRELASRSYEQRTFVRTAATVIKGTLKKGAKVTVAFTTMDGHHVAHRVMIRG